MTHYFDPHPGPLPPSFGIVAPPREWLMCFQVFL